MARLNEILVGRFNKSLQRLFGIKGEPPVATLAPELMPVHVVRNGNEVSYLENWNRFGSGQTVTGAAGNQATIQLRNPASSNVIAVVEKLVIGTGAQQELDISYQFNGADLGSLVPGTPLDGRQGLNQRAVCVPSNSTVTVGGGNVLVRVITANSYECIIYENQEIVLTPGTQLMVQTTVVATALYASYFWRERFLEESERL